MERSRRTSRGVVLAVGALAVLAGCTTSGGQGPQVDAAGVEAQCDTIAAVLLVPAELAPGTGAASLDEPTAEVDPEAVRAVASLVPEDQRGAWAQVVDAVEQDVADPGSVDEATQDQVAATVADSNRVGSSHLSRHATCLAVPPQAKFELVSRSIDADETVDPEEGDAAAPEDALAKIEDGDEAEELDRRDDAVLYGWLDQDGLVVRTVQVVREADGWRKSASRACG